MTIMERNRWAYMTARYPNGGRYADVCNAFNLIQEHLERGIPKLPTRSVYIPETAGRFNCPMCGHCVETEEGYVRYCSNCGQRIGQDNKED